MARFSEGTRVRARRLTWDAVLVNNRLEYPDPRLPTYEGMDEWVTGPLVITHVHSDLTDPAIDYVKVTVGGEDVDEDTIVPVRRPA